MHGKLLRVFLTRNCPVLVNPSFYSLSCPPLFFLLLFLIADCHFQKMTPSYLTYPKVLEQINLLIRQIKLLYFA